MQQIPSLRDFIEGEVERLDRAVATMSEALREAFQLFESQAGRGDGGWTYEVTSEPPGTPGPVKFSQGTTAMVLCALSTTWADRNDSVAVPMSYVRDLKRRESLEGLLDKGEPRSSRALERLARDVEQNKVMSVTFGSDDPLTLTWLLELLAKGRGELQAVQPIIIAACRRAATRWGGPAPVWGGAPEASQPNKRVVQGHAFPALRMVQAERLADGLETRDVPAAAGAGEDGHANGGAGEISVATPADLSTGAAAIAVGRALRLNYGSLREQFEATFQRHVAYNTMSDSRFDPAEMTFAIEGMLQTGPMLDGGTIDRFLDIMQAAQVSSAYWRPVNPIVVFSTGFVLHPVSVETALSLIRICDKVDADPRSVQVTARVIPMLERYWEWLRSQKVTLRPGTGEPAVNGWHSEHVNQSHTIHMWETSQVVLFVTGFQELIERYVARQGVKAARLQIAVPGRERHRSAPQKLEAWQETVREREPVACFGDTYRVYKRIGEAIVEPRLSGRSSSAKCSVLLYGPPGTGKTTVAEEVAKALGWPFLNVTISDFLAEGSDVEARAKAIFEVLGRQRDVVILFDEIDQLLLDRDSKFYRDQESIFQLLTPGMLPKLQGLRTAGTSVFFVATNYEERIDTAIKRRGRIDFRLPVLPYDLERRRSVLHTLLKGRVPVPDAEEVGGDGAPTGLERAARAAFLLGYTDIKAAVDETMREVPSGTAFWDALDRNLRASTRAMRPTGYMARFDLPAEKPQLPFEEFFLILALAKKDGAQSFGEGELSAVEAMLSALPVGIAGRARTDFTLQGQDPSLEAARTFFISGLPRQESSGEQKASHPA